MTTDDPRIAGAARLAPAHVMIQPPLTSIVAPLT
jgi:hypothetical protein